MPDGVYADAWLIVEPINQRIPWEKHERLVIPFVDIYRAHAAVQVLVRAGCRKKNLKPIPIALQPRPNGGGVYRIITMSDAELLTMDDKQPRTYTEPPEVKVARDEEYLRIRHEIELEFEEFMRYRS